MIESKQTNACQNVEGETETVDVLYVFTDDGTYKDGDPVSNEIVAPVTTADLDALGLIASPPSP